MILQAIVATVADRRGVCVCVCSPDERIPILSEIVLYTNAGATKCPVVLVRHTPVKEAGWR